MGGGAYIWLKAGRQVPESVKQAEIRLAGLPTILHIARSGTRERARRRRKGHAMVVSTPISAKYGYGRRLYPLLSRSQF